MDMTQKIEHLEEELKLLKNEVHHTLLDIKDSLTSGYQPPASSVPSSPPVVPTATSAAPAPQPQTPSTSPEKPSESPVEFKVSAEEPPPKVERQEPKPRAQQRQQPAPSPEPEMELQAEAKQAEVMTEEKKDYVPSFIEYRIPAQEQPVQKKANGNDSNDIDRTDLATLATLGNWADRSARKVGRERVEAILEVYQVTGYLPQNLKEVLLKLLSLDNAPVNEGAVSLRDCITVLLELNGIVIGHSKTEAAMLSLLVNGN